MNTRTGQEAGRGALAGADACPGNVTSLVVELVMAAQNTDLAFKDISTLIPKFSESVEEDVNIFIKRVQNVRDIYAMDPALMLLNIKRKLDGSAKKWFHSTPGSVCLSLGDGLEKSSAMFYCVEDAAACGNEKV